MDKTLLKQLKARNEKRLGELRAKLEKNEVREDDIAAVEEEVTALIEEVQALADEIANLDDGDGEGDGSGSENGDGDGEGAERDGENGDEGSDPEGDGSDGENRSGMLTTEQRDRISANIAAGLNVRSQNSNAQIEKRQRSAFANFVVGRISEQEARSLGIEAGNGTVTVPDSMSREIITYAQEENIMRRLGTIVSTDENIKYPVLVKKATAQGHKKERKDNEPIPSTDIEFDEIELEPTEFDALAKVTLKLLKRTGLPIEQIVMDELKKAYVRKEIQYMINGDEVGNVNPGALSKKAVNFTTTEKVLYDALIKMKNSVKKDIRKKSRWILNTAALTKIETMKTDDGFPLLRPLDAPVEGCNYKLLGFLVEEEDAVDKTDAPDVPVFYFGDFSHFYIQDVNGSMEVQKLIEKYADVNMVGFKIYALLDAQLIYSPFEVPVYRYELVETSPPAGE